MVAVSRWEALGTWCEVLTLTQAHLPGVAEIAWTQVAALEAAQGDPGSTQREPLAVARARAADRIAESCVETLGVGCLVNLGGDISVRGEVPAGGWQVEIDDGSPGQSGHPVISMGWPGGLATSGAATGSWRTVTVAARTCEKARAASSAALGLGDAAPRWLTQRELPARLVHVGGVVVQTNGWPRQRWLT